MLFQPVEDGVHEFDNNKSLLSMSPRLPWILALLLSIAGCGPGPRYGPITRWATPVAFDARVKAQVTKEIGSTLAAHAYAGPVTFSDWTSRVGAAQLELDAASTPENFATQINRLLDGYGISHLSLDAPSEVGTPPGGYLRYGFFYTWVKEGALVVDVIPDGPADRAGMRRGDLITHLGDALFARSPLPPCGPEVRLSGTRGSAPLRFALRCSAQRLVAHPHMRWIEPGIAYLRVHSFKLSSYTPREVERLIKDLQGARGLVLDLRFNTGGAFANASHLASLLMPTSGQTLACEVDRASVKNFQQAFGRPGTEAEVAAWGGIPLIHTRSLSQSPYLGTLVVLTDSWTMSSAEALAAGLQGTGRAKVLGMTSAGKVLSVSPDGTGGYGTHLTGGFRLQYPVGRVLGPNLRALEGVGVIPDSPVDLRTSLDDSTVFALAKTLLFRTPNKSPNPWHASR